MGLNSLYTVKFLNFGMREIFVVIYLKFKQRGLRVFCQNDANGIANSEDPDSDQSGQTVQISLGKQCWSRSALFAKTDLSENLESLQ